MVSAADLIVLKQEMEKIFDEREVKLTTGWKAEIDALMVKLEEMTKKYDNIKEHENKTFHDRLAASAAPFQAGPTPQESVGAAVAKPTPRRRTCRLPGGKAPAAQDEQGGASSGSGLGHPKAPVIFGGEEEDGFNLAE